MNIILKPLFIAILLLSSIPSFAQSVTECITSSVPSGWILTNKSRGLECPGYSQWSKNIQTRTRYDNLPVNAYLSICDGQYIPAGWTVDRTVRDFIQCDEPPTLSGTNITVIRHTSCVNQTENTCYPNTPLFGAITASPPVVNVPVGMNGSTTLNWTSNTSSTYVWVSVNGATATAMTGAGSSGTTTPNWIVPGNSYKFILTGSPSSSPALSTVDVTAIRLPAPKIFASPAIAQVPTNQQNGSTTISWDAAGSGYSTVCTWVSIDSAPATLFACGGSTGNQTASWISIGPTFKFFLTPNSNSSTPELASVIVKAQRADGTPTFSASPNPVLVPAGKNGGNFSVYWSAPGYNEVDLYLRLNGGSRYLWGTGSAIGSSVGANGIDTGNILYFEMYPRGNTSNLIKTLTVTGEPDGPATLTASPNPVVIPVGQTSGSFNVYWNAPGYSNIDIYISVNGAPRYLWGTAPATGSSIGVNGIDFGNNYLFEMYPRGNTSTPLKSLAVSTRR